MWRAAGRGQGWGRGGGRGGRGGEISTPEGGTAELTGLRGDRAGFNTNIIPGHGLSGHAAVKTSARVPDTIKSSPPQSCRPRTRESVGEHRRVWRVLQSPGPRHWTLGRAGQPGAGQPGAGRPGRHNQHQQQQIFCTCSPDF